MKADPKVERISFEMRKGVYVGLHILRGERIIMIDTGTIHSPQRYTLPVLNSIGLSFHDIDLILNTHGHHDHAAGNTEIKSASGAPVCIHKADRAFLRDHDHVFDLYIAPFPWGNEE